MIKKFFLIIFFMGISLVYSQEATFDKVQQEYAKFNYDNVIKLSDKLITNGSLSDSLLIELHLMRANVFYSEGADSLTRKSFESILKINKKYIPDPSVTSPKLLSIYNEVKSDYIRVHPDLEVVQKPDTAKPKLEIKYLNQFPPVASVVKNLLLPGLGQLHNGNLTKGWINTAASVFNIGAVIYFSVDAAGKQNDYLKETNSFLIQQKYNEYNKSFRLRNTFIFTYAALWLFSQIDLLVFSTDNGTDQADPAGSRLDLNQSGNNFQLSFRIPF